MNTTGPQYMEKLWNVNYLKVWTSNFLLHFSFTLIVPLLPLYLSETYGAGKDTIGLVLAGYAVMALLVRPFSGYIVDSFPRKTVLLICNFFFFALFGGYIVSGSIIMFAIFRTLHGAPFGATTVALNTVAIDALPSSRRTEGMGYYGLSNNLATAIGPVLAIFLLQWCKGDFQILFIISTVISALGVALDASLKLPRREMPLMRRKAISPDRFFLVAGIPEAATAVCFAICHSIVTTYVAIYGKQELGMNEGTGVFFSLFAIGLIVSRLTGARALRRNQVSRNATIGILVALCGYGLFAAMHNDVGYYLSAFIIGMGNGHWYPAFLNMFINLAEHNQRGTASSSILTAWDAGSGLGVLGGGLVAESLGYHSAFWVAVAVFGIGTSLYFLITRSHFEKNKLR